jgi:heavy metal sensor kinase
LSVRARLTLWYASALAIVLAGYAFAVTGLLRHRLYAALDSKLAEDREVSEQLLQRRADGTFEFRAEDYTGDNLLGFALVVQSTDGVVRATYPRDPPPRWYRAIIPLPQGPRTIVDGEASLRVLSADEVVGGQRVVLHVARPEAPLQDQMREIVMVLGLLLPIAVLIAVFGGFMLARKALLPIARMADQAKRISAERLGERMPIVNPKDEVGRLGQAFNDTLVRLERAFIQLRRFTADASHELRTPLTALRSVGEVGLRNERDVAGHREVIGSMLEEVDRMTRLVDALLLLARSDGGALVLAPSSLDLADLARDVVASLAVLAEDKHLQVEVMASEPARVAGDATLLRQVLVNLVHNAIRHSPEGGSITIGFATGDGVVQCDVRDSGPGIPPEHRARLFERFYRVDDARTRRSGGAGLGLALARSVVELHGGSIGLVDDPRPGAWFRMQLPRADDAH